MSYFVIIRGPLGIGKTTIAKILSRKLNAEYISIDKVLEENGLDKEDNNFFPEDFVKTNEIVLSKVKKDLSRGKIVVFDGCFYFKEQIEHLLKNLKFKHYIFTLKASLDECIKRDKLRKGSLGEKAAKDVFKLVSRFDYGTIINTNNKTPEEVVSEILSLLV
jgi:shikimate kinase